MIGIDSRLYEVMTSAMQLILINVVCFIIAVPIVTLPLAILCYCLLCGNVVQDRRMFRLPKLNKQRVIQLVLYFVVGLCSLYSSYILIQMKDFFISRLILSVLLSFNVTGGILIIERDMSFFATYRNAFFYSIAFFYKSILPVFAFLMFLSKMMNGILPVYAVLIMSCLLCYFVFKWNYKGLMKLYQKADS